MGIATGISAGMGLVGGLVKTIDGAKTERDATKALNDYERQEFKNIGDSMSVSTLGSDLQREEQARLASTQIDALRGGGTRTLIGGLGRVEAGNQAVNRQIGADLDMQQKQIEQIQAEDEARIRSMRENRENADVAALSSQVQAGRQDKWGGIGNMIQGVGMLGGAAGRKSSESLASNMSAGSEFGGTPNNELSTGVLTKTGGSGIGATSGFGYDEFGMPTTPSLRTQTNTPLTRRKNAMGFPEDQYGNLIFD